MYIFVYVTYIYTYIYMSVREPSLYNHVPWNNGRGPIACAGFGTADNKTYHVAIRDTITSTATSTIAIVIITTIITGVPATRPVNLRSWSEGYRLRGLAWESFCMISTSQFLIHPH